MYAAENILDTWRHIDGYSSETFTESWPAQVLMPSTSLQVVADLYSAIQQYNSCK